MLKGSCVGVTKKRAPRLNASQLFGHVRQRHSLALFAERAT